MRPRRFREDIGVVTVLEENRERMAEDISGSRGSAIRYVARKAQVCCLPVCSTQPRESR